MTDMPQFPDEDTLPADALATIDPALVDDSWPEDFRAGFVTIVGRPNAGKSTLTNALVGEKISIMSDRPETTRHAVRGIVQREDGQLVLVDTPGLHRPRTLLGERLNDVVRESLIGVDAVVVCLPADEKTGPGDRYVTALVSEAKVPVFAVVTKVDKVSRAGLAERLMEVTELAEFSEIVPVSALRGEQVELLENLLMDRMPTSPPLYPRGQVTDESRDTRIAELVREAALEGVRDELPHSLAVLVEEVQDRGNVLAIYVSLFVERDSQKAIVIGKGGSRLRDVGTRVRHELEEMLGKRIYLDLHVKVAKDWQRDPKQLGKLGF